MILLNIIFIILSSASVTRRDLSILFSRATLAGFILILYNNYNSTYFQVLEKGLPLYNGLYQCNNNSHIFNIFILALSFMILSLTSYYPRKANTQANTQADTPGLVSSANFPTITNSKSSVIYDLEAKMISEGLKDSGSKIEKDNGNTHEANLYEKNYSIDKTSQQFKILEYPLLILFVISGAIFLMSTNDIISIFISIELQSYGLYLLSSVYRNSELSTKAGLTYFLLGGLSSCIILLSQGLLYVNSGSTNLENIYLLSNASILGVIDVLNNMHGISYINICLIVLSVGFLFKVSAAPFHFWSPDVYDGVPTLVTTFIAIVAKISIFVFLLELVHYTSNNQLELLDANVYNWNNNLLLSALLSLIIGSILGLTQFRIKRLYAYSTISHVGFILLALSINTTESIQAFIFYLLQYSISNLNAFIILLAVGYFYINFYKKDQDSTKNLPLKERNNSPIQLITQIKGLYKLNTMLSLSFAITLFSFLGVPPLLGFFGKQMVLSASLDSGYVFMSLVAILTSVISAVYYLILIKQMFFDKSEYEHIDTLYGVAQANTETNIEASPCSATEDSSENSLAKKVQSNNTSFGGQPLHIKLSSSITSMISILTLITLVFMFISPFSLNLTQILSLYVMNI